MDTESVDHKHRCKLKTKGWYETIQGFKLEIHGVKRVSILLFLSF